MKQQAKFPQTLVCVILSLVFGLLLRETGLGQEQAHVVTGNVTSADDGLDWLASGIDWTSGPVDSWDRGWNLEWEAAAQKSCIRFDQWGGMNYTRYTTGTFSINKGTNQITLHDNTLIAIPGNWMSPSSEVFTVVKAYENFQEKGIWFETDYNEDIDEWLVLLYTSRN